MTDQEPRYCECPKTPGSIIGVHDFKSMVHTICGLPIRIFDVSGGGPGHEDHLHCKCSENSRIWPDWLACVNCGRKVPGSPRRLDFAPLLAKAEAAEGLAEALKPFAKMADGGEWLEILTLADAMNAVRALAAWEKVKGGTGGRHE